MKRMIDGIISYSVTSGSYTTLSDTTPTVIFNFPLGYWPISLSSKPFSIIPGRLTCDGGEVTALCSNSTSGSTWIAVQSYSGVANMIERGYTENNIEYKFTYENKKDRDDFIKSLFGNGNGENIKFIVPVSMVLVPFAGAFEN